ncbi:MAG: hypothetical protein ACK48Y_25800 [Planctomyces sp.]|jgi:hypothetical protein
MEIATPPGIPALVTSNLLIFVATKVLFPFKAKTAELKADTARVTEAQGNVDPTRGTDVLTVYDWSQKAAKIWRGSNTAVRRQILDSICLNRQVSDVTLVTTKRKPFDFFAERLDLKKNRGECASFEREAQLVSEYVAEAFESNRLDIPLILQPTGSADT